MRVLVITNVPPRADGNTMGVQQTFYRLRKLIHAHEFIVAYTNPEQLPEPQTCAAVPFQLVRLPNPARAKPAPPPRSHIERQLRAWQHTLIATAPQIYHELHDRALNHAISELVSARVPDIVHVIGEPMLMNTPSFHAPLLADFPDLFSILFARTNRAALRKRTHQWQHAREMDKIRRIERSIMTRATAALFVSETDRAAAQKIFPAARTFVVPNAVDLDFFQSTETQQENIILFTGTLSYAPNIQALQFFQREIFPRLVAAVPHAQFHIVGYNPPPEILAMQNEQVQVFANVPDVRPYLARAAVCIAPILSGSGTRIKIIEAWAMHQAVVSTRIGAEGLDAQHGTHLLLHDDAPAFADAVIALLRNPAQRRALGENGYRLAAEKYSMTRAANDLNAVYQLIYANASDKAHAA